MTATLVGAGAARDAGRGTATALTATFGYGAGGEAGRFDRTLLTLRVGCRPARGSAADPAAACRSLARWPAAYLGPPRGGCAGGIVRWNVAVRGVVAGRHVDRVYDMCDDQAQLWGGLTGHPRLRLPAHGTVTSVAQGRTVLAPGRAWPDDVVRCPGGYGARVPDDPARRRVAHALGDEPVLQLRLNPDQSVTAVCR